MPTTTVPAHETAEGLKQLWLDWEYAREVEIEACDISDGEPDDRTSCQVATDAAMEAADELLMTIRTIRNTPGHPSRDAIHALAILFGDE